MINRKLTEEQVLELIDGQDLKMGREGRDRDRDRDADRPRDRDADRPRDKDTRDRDSERPRDRGIDNPVNIGGDHSEIIGDYDIYGSNILFV